jgi:hypothetical protein
MTRSASSLDAAAFGIVAALLLLSERWTTFGFARVALWCVAAATPAVLPLLLAAPDSTAPRGWQAALFSSSHGLLSLTPVAYVALAGTIVYLRRNPFWGASALAVFALWVVLGIGLIGALAILAPGLAFAIDRAARRPLLAVAPLVLFALAWNYWLMVQYTTGALPKDEPVSFAALVRQQADVHTRSPYLYPFAFPANVWFAWREGVPADRYELLAFEARRPNIDLVMNRQADRFLLDGWDAPGSDLHGPVRWIGQSRASIVLPLAPVPGKDLHVHVLARARLEQPAVDADLGVEMNDHEIGRFIVPAAAPAEAQLTIPAAAVGRIMRAGYNRLTFVSYGVRRADPADSRPPGPLASRPATRAWPVAIYRIRTAPAS